MIHLSSVTGRSSQSRGTQISIPPAIFTSCSWIEEVGHEVVHKPAERFNLSSVSLICPRDCSIAHIRKSKFRRCSGGILVTCSSHVKWLSSMCQSSSSTLSLSQTTELIILSLRENPDTQLRKPLLPLVSVLYPTWHRMRGDKNAARFYFTVFCFNIFCLLCLCSDRTGKRSIMPDSPADVKTQSRLTPPTMPPPPSTQGAPRNSSYTPTTCE